MMIFCDDSSSANLIIHLLKDLQSSWMKPPGGASRNRQCGTLTSCTSCCWDEVEGYCLASISYIHTAYIWYTRIRYVTCPKSLPDGAATRVSLSVFEGTIISAGSVSPSPGRSSISSGEMGTSSSFLVSREPNENYIGKFCLKRRLKMNFPIL